jgi:hypothetical protein
VRTLRSTILSLLAAVASAASSQALAQLNPFTPNIARMALGQAILNNGRHAVDAATAAAVDAANRKAQAAAESKEIPLTYDPDPRLSDWTRVFMTDTLSKEDPDVRGRMEKAFADNVVLKDFDRFMDARGYSSRDVSDDMAELLLVSWQIVTGHTATDEQTRGVHEQTRASFLANPQVRTMTNADRQLLGERIAYQVMISSSASQQSLKGGDQSQRVQLRESAAAMMRREGIDPRLVRLTDRGFVR